MSPSSTTGTTIREFKVPDLGEGLEDATVVAWHVDVGDDVALNQPLCTLETAKAEVEIPSPFAGRLVARTGEPGDTLDVGTELARIEVTGAGPPPGDGPAASGDISGANLVGYGTSESTSRRRRSRRVEPVDVPPTEPPTEPPTTEEHARAKPKTRQLARDLAVDLEALHPGSGADGRVTRDDVLAAADAGSVMQDARPGTRSASQKPDGPTDELAAGDTIPVQGVRARIADHLTAAHREIPAASATVDVDCARLLSLRTTLNADAEAAGRQPVVTPFSLLLHLLVAAVGRHPTLNARFDATGPTITLHPDVHLGVATATDRGLVVPVVRAAQQRSVLDLSTEVRRLASAARDGSLAPTELVGSTITVSNFGALGLDSGTPIINAPEAAIIGVGAIRERAVVISGEVVARPTATVSATFDHRVNDGTEIGAFLSTLRSFVEEPARAL